MYKITYYIVLIANEVNIIGSQYLSESLHYYHSLKKLNLLFCGVNDNAIVYIARKFSSITNLEKLNLRSILLYVNL